MSLAVWTRRLWKLATALIAATCSAFAGAAAWNAVPAYVFGAPLAPHPGLVIACLYASYGFGLSFFSVLSVARKLSFADYCVYSIVIGCSMLSWSMVMAGPLAPFSWFDLAWRLLTEAVPGGTCAGIVAWWIMSRSRPCKIPIRPA